MSAMVPDDRGDPAPMPATPADVTPGQPVVDPLRALLNDLARLARGEPEATAVGAGPVAAWSDGGTVYVEVDLPEAAGVFLDISVHDGRVFIRLAK
jgi:hypothetical protein